MHGGDAPCYNMRCAVHLEAVVWWESKGWKVAQGVSEDMLVRESRVQAPALDACSDMPLFNTKAVVRQTGAPAPTLRAWERRYGVLAPRRGENGYRLYSERDIAIIAWLRDRVESGLTISQAIALMRSLDLGRKRRRGRPPSGPISHDGLEAVAAYDGAPRATAMSSMAAPRRLSLDELSEALVSQFIALDEAAANRTIAEAFAVYALDEVCLSLITPTLARAGELWEDGEVSVTVEHFASAVVRGQLEALFRAAPAAAGPLALVGCAPGELHELGALMLALLLRRAGVRVVYLGQNVEIAGLISAVQAVRPACVLLSATQRAHAEALAEVGRRLDALGARKPAFYVGGQAFVDAPELTDRIPGAHLTMDATRAVDEIRRGLVS
jgi:MerR family transcriptional regulator, light-induced transcriptional regulator